MRHAMFSVLGRNRKRIVRSNLEIINPPTNLYTIVPLRTANAWILIEQSIGRGLRLTYGKRTGITTVDRLNIVAHDRFQEIVDETNRSDSVIRLSR